MNGFFVYKHCKLFPHGCESLSGDFCKIWLLHWIKRLMTSNTGNPLSVLALEYMQYKERPSPNREEVVVVEHSFHPRHRFVSCTLFRFNWLFPFFFFLKYFQFSVAVWLGLSNKTTWLDLGTKHYSLLKAFDPFFSDLLRTRPIFFFYAVHFS